METIYRHIIDKLQNEDIYYEISPIWLYADKEAHLIMKYPLYELQRIALYYNISIFNKTDIEIIQDIQTFEMNRMNIEKVKERREIWKYTYENKRNMRIQRK